MVGKEGETNSWTAQSVRWELPNPARAEDCWKKKSVQVAKNKPTAEHLEELQTELEEGEVYQERRFEGLLQML